MSTLGKGDRDVLIETGICDPVAISLAQNLLTEAEIPFVTVNENVVARQESGNVLGFWSICVPAAFESEARGIIQAVEGTK